MQETFWAKSNGETIIQHTNRLLENYDMLKKIYPEIPDDGNLWSLLKLACKYHDLGKMNHFFQEKIREGSMKKLGEIPHALLSITMLPLKELRKEYGIESVKALTYAIALHHERDFSQINEEQYQKEIALLAEPISIFDFNQLGLNKPEKIKEVSENYYSFNSRLQSSDVSFYKYVMLKGLLNKIDYAASGDYPVEYPAVFLESNISNVLKKWRKSDSNADWNAMQQYAHEHQDENLLIIGQTGLGKTEAGLRWIGNHKGFFTLPLKAAINAIYERIIDGIADADYIDKEVGILHSDSLSVLLDEKEQTNQTLKQIENYMKETRAWSLPLTITTLDQTFDFVYHYAGFESKLATFSYSKIVIDEIQMYSPDLLAYLIKGLQEIQDFGGKFLIMTATMPQYLIELFEKNDIKLVKNEQPFLDENLFERHYLKTVSEELTAESVFKRYQEGNLLIICNTIRKAKEIFDGLENTCLDVPVHMLHSQFIRSDRQQKEIDIKKFADSHQKGIWVATQVVEASLDIDFDMLITELSELNGLFQRMGRCYRKRPLADKTQPNVYVFTGGKNTTSGIGTSEHAVVHQDIFDLSKKAIADYDGVLNEQKKMDMIAETYSTDKMAETEYYEQIAQMLVWLKSIENDNTTKEKVHKLFRNINTRSVIPKNVYEDNRKAIDDLVTQITVPTKELSEEKSRIVQLKKGKARSRLEGYMLSLPEYMVSTCWKNSEFEDIKITDFFHLFIVGGDYEKKYGFRMPYNKKAEDNIF